jgi:hypothetical protein
VIKRSTWFLLAVFILLLGFVFYWQRSGIGEEAEATPTLESLLLNINLDDLREVAIKGRDANSVSFTRNEKGQWVFVDPGVTIDESTDVALNLGQLASLRILNSFTTAPQAEITGLDNPAYVISIQLSNGVKHELLLGELTPTGTGYYARLGDGPVSVVPQYELDQVINLYIDPPIAEETSLTPETNLETILTVSP